MSGPSPGESGGPDDPGGFGESGGSGGSSGSGGSGESGGSSGSGESGGFDGSVESNETVAFEGGEVGGPTVVAPGIVRIGVGTGSPEGQNSAYVLPDRGVVVDPGPPSDDAWERLVTGIEAAGLAVDEVVLVLVTHWHADHAGLAPRLAEAADATLAMHEADAPLVADYAAERERRIDRDARRLRAWGVPDDRVAALREGDRPSPMPDSYPVRELVDGECVLGIRVLHTPGHTLGGATFVVEDDDEEDGNGSPRGTERPTLLVGDHVLPTYTPNVGGGDTRLFGFDDEADPGAVDPDNPSPLWFYLDALDRLVEWDGRRRRCGEHHAGGDDLGGVADDGDTDPPTPLVLPGHGTDLDLAERAAVIDRHHRERAERVLDAVRAVQATGTDGESGGEGASGDGVTPWAVARELFGEMDGIHAKMGVGEAAAHLVDLRCRGLVGVVGEEPVRYSAVGR
ncbi:MBL fold metallo-hydrolase [Halobium salinum]|uniref:MBL fold metallo-hydrolase n=1 Tax=Halobium salinum TaxID=1364940 RepID=A0ABD5PEK0_9EURY|nr:MBL fold metallo-hydrolase [Halobium salinum]